MTAHAQSASMSCEHEWSRGMNLNQQNDNEGRNVSVRAWASGSAIVLTCALIVMLGTFGTLWFWVVFAAAASACGGLARLLMVSWADVKAYHAERGE